METLSYELDFSRRWLEVVKNLRKTVEQIDSDDKNQKRRAIAFVVKLDQEIGNDLRKAESADNLSEEYANTKAAQRVLANYGSGKINGVAPPPARPTLLRLLGEFRDYLVAVERKQLRRSIYARVDLSSKAPEKGQLPRKWRHVADTWKAERRNAAQLVSRKARAALHKKGERQEDATEAKGKETLKYLESLTLPIKLVGNRLAKADRATGAAYRDQLKRCLKNEFERCYQKAKTEKSDTFTAIKKFGELLKKELKESIRMASKTETAH